MVKLGIKKVKRLIIWDRLDSSFSFSLKKEEKTLLIRLQSYKSYISDVIQRTIKIQEATPRFASS
jgi:hypothetical protein